MLALSLVSFFACSKDETSDEVDDTINVNQSNYTYTYNGKTYRPCSFRHDDGISDFTSLNIYATGRHICWDFELCGTIDDALGPFLNFDIFDKNVGKGFTLTKDNFCVQNPGSGSSYYYKKSGSATFTEFENTYAIVVFKQFVMEAEGADDIVVNGTAFLVMD